MLRPLDRERLRAEFLAAKPYPWVKIDNFIEPTSVEQIASAYPSFDVALGQGRTFATINERRKVQITDSSKYARPVAELNDLLASEAFLSELSYITAIPNLLADETLSGGGIHITGPGGRLDVHVDFNYIEDRQLHRRLNLLLYLNAGWQDDWGGQFQMWDKDVKRCEVAFSPVLNRCVIFETSDVSYHGVVPISPDAPTARKSFATYYYTKEAPSHWTGTTHSTIFKARPEEKIKGLVLMPAEAAQSQVRIGLKKLKSRIKSLVRR